MTDIIKDTIEDRRRELLEKLVSEMPHPRDQRYIQALRDAIVEGDGEIHYIDSENGNNINDGLSMATAWENWGGVRADMKAGDIVVKGSRVFVLRGPQSAEEVQ